MKVIITILGIISVFLLIVASLGYYLAPVDSLDKSAAIIAISGGDTHARTETAVRLYNDDWAPRLIVAGAAADPNSISNAVAMRRIATRSGVPETAITVEESSRDTAENAKNVAELFDQPPSKIILVTSPYHQRRASIQFEEALPGTEIINYPAFDQTWRRSLWWVTPRGWYLTISESAKIVFIRAQS